MFAQQNHFVYLQTYNNQPFYLRMDNKVLSSSATGYLIIPKLSDGAYQLIIGFAKNQFPEQIFQISVRGNIGFELKNFGEKGWGLFDLQNSEVIMGGNSPITQAPVTASVPKKSDAFADMLSSVVKDSSIRVDDSTELKNTVSKKPVEEEKPVVVSNTNTSASTAENVMLYTDVRRTLENITADGMERVYIDNNGKQADTIRIFIAGQMNKYVILEEPANLLINEVKKSDTATEVTKDVTVPATTVVKPAPKFIEDAPKKSDDNSKASSNSKSLGMINSDCHSIATEEDFLKLRKRMAAEKDDENMIKVAKKALKAKCYNAAYIKNLSVLFLTDKGRYNFFDTAYPFVEDSQNFPDLEKELSDTYYITRFRAMIHK